jgi:hypothetical protein
LGTLAFLEKKLASYSASRLLGIFTLLIPIMMLAIGFDDHDRSGRTLQVDHARNVLNSCAPNAILFTGGDNDTFPLWYVQEVEGFRTDVRVIVLSYFNGDWYIDQMQRRMYESDPLHFSMSSNDYRQGGLIDILPFVENPNISKAINLKKFLELVRSGNRSLQVSMAGGTKYNSIPSRTFFIEVDSASVIHSGIVPVRYQTAIPDKLLISWRGNFMEKSAFMVLDLIANNNWERPIYFNLTSLNSISLNLKKHVLQEGHVYRLLPISLKNEGAIDTDKMYENLMIKSVFRGLDNEDVYYNHEDYQLRILQSTKSNYNILANDLLDRSENDKAVDVMDFMVDNFLKENINLDVSSVSTVDLLLRTGKNDKAIQLATSLYEQSEAALYYLQQAEALSAENVQIHLFICRRLYDIGVKYGYSALAKKCAFIFNEYVSMLSEG